MADSKPRVLEVARVIKDGVEYESKHMRFCVAAAARDCTVTNVELRTRKIIDRDTGQEIALKEIWYVFANDTAFQEVYRNWELGLPIVVDAHKMWACYQRFMDIKKLYGV